MKGRITRKPLTHRLGLIVSSVSVLLLVPQFTRPLHAVPVTVLTDPDGISGFEFYSYAGLIWWDSSICAEADEQPGTIRLRASDPYGSTKNVARNCDILASNSANAVADGSYVYFFNDGQLHRKALNASQAAASTPFPTPPFSPTLPLGQGATFLELADGYLWFGRYQSGNGQLGVYRFRVDGSEDAQSIVSIADADADVRKLRWFQYLDGSDSTITALAILLENGKLYRYRFGRPGNLTLLTTGVVDFAVHQRSTFTTSTTSIYAAKGQTGAFAPGAPAGTLVRILADTGEATTIYIAQEKNQVLAVGADGPASFVDPQRNLYLTEGIVTCGDLFCQVTDTVIRRNRAPGTDGSWDVMVQTGGGVNLRSDNQYLYFLSDNRIVREDTDAPSILFDLQAENLEIVQFMQTLNADQPLIAGKQGTMARGYARLTTNTTGTATWLPSAQLRVFIDGNEITGSPFSPINNANITEGSTVTFARSNLLNSFLFRLGPLPPGILTAAFTVNPKQTIYETGSNPYVNNSVSLPQSIAVAPSSVPCLLLVPVPTVLGRFWPSDPTVPLILQRAATLLPVQDLDVRDWAQFADDHGINDDLYFIFPFGGLNSGDEQDDAALDAIECVRCSSSYPPGCDAAHWVGMIHPGLNTNYVGFGGGLGNRPGRCLIASMRSDGNPIAAPIGGRILAHELGHNYGRAHVGCACSTNGSIPPPWPKSVTTPEDWSLEYPGPWCSILPGNTGTDFGFDWISQTPIDPTVTGDLMTYACSRWTSRYTWNNTYLSMFATTISPGFAPGPLSTARAGPARQNSPLPERVLFVTAVIRTNEATAMFKWFYQLPSSQVDSHNLMHDLAAAENERTNANHLSFHLLGANGALLREIPVPLDPVTDGTLDRYFFAHYVPFDPLTRRVQLVQGNLLYAERVVSPNAPTIQLGALTVNAGAQTAQLNWTASDADGDPLYFFIHYSADNGVSWDARSHDYHSTSVTLNTRHWKGGDQSRLRVLVTDGINTAFAITEPFSIPNYPPEIVLGGVAEDERIAFGESRELLIVAVDAEDGRSGVRVSWTLSGATPRTGVGSSIPLNDLAPGSYVATVTALDRSNQQSNAERRFEVLPLLIPDGPAPRLDGASADMAYAKGAFLRVPLNNGEFAPVRLVHSGGNLFVAFGELPYDARGGNRSVGLRVDVNDNHTRAPEATDLGFFVNDDGIPFQENGTPSGMVVTLSPQLGFDAVVQRGSNAWSAEFRIADHLLGGWRRAVSMMADHGEAVWPSAAKDDSPVTWAGVMLGTELPAPANRLPRANAGENLVVNVSMPRLVTLNGSASYDPDGDPLMFRWTQVSGPTLSVSNTNTAHPSFLVSPGVANDLIILQLTVSDTTGESPPDEVQVVLSPVRRSLPASEFGSVLSDGSFLGRVRGTPGEFHVVEASSDFEIWTPIATNTVDFLGFLQFVDADLPKFSYRFYRSVQQ